MILALAAGGLVVTATMGLMVLIARRRFISHLDALDAELREPDGIRETRADLPADVVALATRMGARVVDAPAFVAIEQSGQMWQKPGGKPVAFTARQTIRVGTPGFLWRATMGSVVVADHLVAGIGGLDVMLLGAFPLARMIGSAAVNRGEALRYLAELPWCPDAILSNTSLDWTVLDAKTIEVATGTGTARGTVTFELDDDGWIVRASAPSRAYAEASGRTSEHPWHGRFWDYQRIGDHFMPMHGEVAWGLPAGDFVYWRGRLLDSAARDHDRAPH